MNTKVVKKDLSEMKPFEIETYVLKMFGAKATPNCTSGIDGTIVKNGQVVSIEIKVHGLNRCSLGVIDLTKTVSQNIKNLLVADYYINVRPQENKIIAMTKSEMATWLFDKVVLDKNRHKKDKFKINYYERSKRQDMKFKELGVEIA